KILLIWNWWIGSAAMTGRSRLSSSATALVVAFDRRVRNASGHDSCLAHHVQHAGREAEHREHEHPPRQGAESPVDQPAESRTDQHARDKFGGEPETARESRMIGGQSGSGACFGAARTSLFEPFAETLEPRGEGGFIGWRCAPIFPPARVTGHRPNPRSRGNPKLSPPPKPRGPY